MQNQSHISTNNESPSSTQIIENPTKAIITPLFSKPLETLIDICGSIEAPSLSELEEMLLNYKITEGNIWYSVFISKWPNFYCLPELLKQVIKAHETSNPTVKNICIKLLETIESCRENIDIALGSTPNLRNTASKEIEKAFFEQMVIPCHRHLKNMCSQVFPKYSEKLSDACKKTVKVSSQRITLIEFMRQHCEPQSYSLLNSRKNSLQKAHQNNKIKLPVLANPWTQGQSKYYFANDLISNWSNYCNVLPNLPQLKN